MSHSPPDQLVVAGARLVTFGEALLSGYPFWLERTDGARFESPMQKVLHAHYLDQAVQIEAGHLDRLCHAAKQLSLATILGIIERLRDRGGHSLYASLVYIDAEGVIGTVHRKLVPTYIDSAPAPWAASTAGRTGCAYSGSGGVFPGRYSSSK